ncbi:MAG: hypothetical protein ACPG47_10550, partial [Leucothrix sp.]
MTVSACTTLDRHPQTEMVPCVATLRTLDRLALTHAGTLLGNRLAHMPWLRHNRLITYQINQQAELNKLLQAMAVLAKKGLSYELATVPLKSILDWQARYQIRLTPEQFIADCSNTLIKQQLARPEKTWHRLKSISPDNDYSTAARVAGLYPAVSLPFRLGVVKEQRQLAKEWGAIHDKRWFAYRPPLANLQSALDSWRLLHQHAPTWLIDSSTQANLLGTPYWQNGHLKVNENATTYAFVSEARFK